LSSTGKTGRVLHEMFLYLLSENYRNQNTGRGLAAPGVCDLNPIVFNMCDCSDGIVPGNTDLLFTKTPVWKKWIPALFVFSQPVVFATIPKDHKASPRDCRLRLPRVFHLYYWVAASSQSSFIGMGIAFRCLNTYPDFAGMTV